MELALIDVVIFLVFIAAVISFGIYKSRDKGEKDSESYFLAGRGLNWWLIGFSLIAANISAEQFVGMSGQAAKDGVGLAIASYEWIAAVTLVVVAFFFLPKFLRSGIYTIPEYLEYRYDHSARAIMSLSMVVMLVCVNVTCIIYLGAKALQPLFVEQTVFGYDLNITLLSWIVGISAAAYVAVGGLKACAWTDLFWGSSLIVGGAIIMLLTFMALDKPEDFDIDAAAVTESIGVDEGATLGEKFQALKDKKMHMVLPADSPSLPWTALILGIWIPNFYYWGLNQYIMQRTLGARSLADGQRGIVFAAGLKLVIPFIVCIPGIIAFTLYADKMQQVGEVPAVAESEEDAPIKEDNNTPTLREFESVKGAPAKSGKLFPFDGDFAKLYPERAQELVAFNAAVAGEEVPAGDDLAGLNGDLIKQATRMASKAGDDLQVQTELVGYDYDSAFPTLVANLVPTGLRGFVLAALMGAVVSSLAAILNAASTIFTMDIYKQYLNKKASQKTLVFVGRCCVPVAVLVGCIIAPKLAAPEYKGAFHFIQEFQGYISPGILTVFLFGLFVPRTPRFCGAIGLLLCPVIYGLLHLLWGDQIAFLNRMAITVGALSVLLAAATALLPLAKPVELPTQKDFDMTSSGGAKMCGLAVVVVTVVLYAFFW